MTVAKPKTFTANLESVGDKLKWVIVRVPFDIAKAWPERNGRRVRGEINGIPFRSSLFPEKGTSVHMLVVNRKMQASAKARPGSPARITMEPDMEQRNVELPAEFTRALKGARGLRKYFEAISPSMQKGLMMMIDGLKSPDSRRNRAERIAEALMQAMEGEEYPPPILRAAFQRQPLAEAGWKAMTPIQRRNHLLGIFYYQSTDARERRTERAIEEAVRVAKRKSAQPTLSM